MEHYNLYPDGTMPSYHNAHLVSGERCPWYPGEVRNIDGEAVDDLVLDIDVATLLALHRPLGRAVRASPYTRPAT